jgi:hypothetical protein
MKAEDFFNPKVYSSDPMDIDALAQRHLAFLMNEANTEDVECEEVTNQLPEGKD